MARPYPHAEGLRVNSEEGETFLIAKVSEVFTSITNNYTIHWFKDGQLQTGHINSSSYLVEDDGQYELVVTNYGYCSDSTGTYMHNITGMQNTQSTAVSLYPNPVLNTLHLSQKLDWSILSDKGEVLLHGVGQEVEMGEITSGTYILQLNNNGAISNQSFVKQ